MPNNDNLTTPVETATGQALYAPAQDVEVKVPEQVRLGEKVKNLIETKAKKLDETINSAVVDKRGYDIYRNREKIATGYQEGKYFQATGNFDILSKLVFRLSQSVGAQEEAVELIAPYLRQLIKATDSPLLKQLLSTVGSGILRAESAKDVALKQKLFKKLDSTIGLIRDTGVLAFNSLKATAPVITATVKDMSSNFTNNTDDFFTTMLSGAGFLGPFLKIAWPYLSKMASMMVSALKVAGQWVLKGLFSPAKYLVNAIMSRIFKPKKEQALTSDTVVSLVKGVKSLTAASEMLSHILGESKGKFIVEKVTNVGKKVTEGHTLGEIKASPFESILSVFKGGYFENKPKVAPATTTASVAPAMAGSLGGYGLKVASSNANNTKLSIHKTNVNKNTITANNIPVMTGSLGGYQRNLTPNYNNIVQENLNREQMQSPKLNGFKNLIDSVKKEIINVIASIKIKILGKNQKPEVKSKISKAISEKVETSKSKTLISSNINKEKQEVSKSFSFVTKLPIIGNLFNRITISTRDFIKRTRESIKHGYKSISRIKIAFREFGDSVKDIVSKSIDSIKISITETLTKLKTLKSLAAKSIVNVLKFPITAVKSASAFLKSKLFSKNESKEESETNSINSNIKVEGVSTNTTVERKFKELNTEKSKSFSETTKKSKESIASKSAAIGDLVNSLVDLNKSQVNYLSQIYNVLAKNTQTQQSHIQQPSINSVIKSPIQSAKNFYNESIVPLISKISEKIGLSKSSVSSIKPSINSKTANNIVIKFDPILSILKDIYYAVDSIADIIESDVVNVDLSKQSKSVILSALKQQPNISGKQLNFFEPTKFFKHTSILSKEFKQSIKPVSLETMKQSKILKQQTNVLFKILETLKSKSFFGWLFKGFSSITNLIKSIKKIPEAIKNAALYPFRAIKSLFTKLGDKIKSSIKAGFNFVTKPFRDVAKSLKSAVTGIKTSIVSAFKTSTKYIKDSFNNVVKGTKSIFSNIGSSFKSLFKVESKSKRGSRSIRIESADIKTADLMVKTSNANVEVKKTFFSQLTEGFKNTFKSLTSNFSGLSSIFKGFFAKKSETITAKDIYIDAKEVNVSKTSGWLGKIFSLALAPIMLPFKLIGLLFSSTKKYVKSIDTSIKKQLLPLLENNQALLNKQVDYLKSIDTGVNKLVKKFITSENKSMFKDFFKNSIERIKSVFTNVKYIGSQAASKIKNKLVKPKPAAIIKSPKLLPSAIPMPQNNIPKLPKLELPVNQKISVTEKESVAKINKVGFDSLRDTVASGFKTLVASSHESFKQQIFEQRHQKLVDKRESHDSKTLDAILEVLKKKNFGAKPKKENDFLSSLFKNLLKGLSGLAGLGGLLSGLGLMFGRAVLGALAGLAAGLVKGVATAIKGGFKAIKSIFKSIPKTLSKIKDILVKSFKGAIKKLPDAVKAIKDLGAKIFKKSAKTPVQKIPKSAKEAKTPKIFKSVAEHTKKIGTALKAKTMKAIAKTKDIAKSIKDLIFGKKGLFPKESKYFKSVLSSIKGLGPKFAEELSKIHNSVVSKLTGKDGILSKITRAIKDNRIVSPILKGISTKTEALTSKIKDLLFGKEGVTKRISSKFGSISNKVEKSAKETSSVLKGISKKTSKIAKVTTGLTALQPEISKASSEISSNVSAKAKELKGSVVTHSESVNKKLSEVEAKSTSNVEGVKKSVEVKSQEISKNIKTTTESVNKEIGEKSTEVKGSIESTETGVKKKIVESGESIKSSVKTHETKVSENIAKSETKVVTETKGISEKIGKSTSEVSTKVEGVKSSVETQSKVLEEKVGKTSEEIKTSVESKVSEVKGSVETHSKSLNESINKTSGEVSTKVEGVKSSVETQSKVLEEKVGKSTSEVSTKVEGVKSELSENLTKTSAELKGSVETQSKTLTENISKSTGEVSSKVEGVKSSVETHSKSLNESVAKSTGELSANVENAKATVTENLTKSTGEIKGSVESQTKAVSEKIGSSSTELGSKVEGAKATVTENLTKASTELKGSVETHSKSLNENLAKSTGEVSSKVEGVKSSLSESLIKTSTELKGTVESQAKTLNEEVAKTSSELKGTVETQSKALSENLAKTSSEVSSKVEGVKSSVETQSKALSENISKSTGELSANVEGVKSSVETQSKVLNEQMSTTSSEIKGTVETANKSINENVVKSAEGVNTKVETLNKNLTESLQQTTSEIKTSVSNQQKAISERLSTTETKVSELKGSVETQAKVLNEQMSTTSSEVKSSVETANKSINENVAKSTEAMSAKVENANKLINENLANTSNEIKTSVESQSSTLSEKLAKSTGELQSSVANQQKVLSESIESARSEIGSNFENTNKAISNVNESISAESANVKSTLKAASEETKAVVQSVGESVESASSAIKGSISETKASVEASTKVINSSLFDKGGVVEQINTKVGNSVESISSKVENVGSAVAENAKGIFEVKGAVNSTEAKVAKVLASSEETTSKLETLGKAINSISKNIANTVIEVSKQTHAAIKTVNENLKVMSKSLGAILKPVTKPKEIKLKETKVVFKETKPEVKTVKAESVKVSPKITEHVAPTKSTTQTLPKLVEKSKTGISNILNSAKSVVSNVKHGIAEKINNVKQSVKHKVSNVVEKIGNSKFGQTAKKVWNNKWTQRTLKVADKALAALMVYDLGEHIHSKFKGEGGDIVFGNKNYWNLNTQQRVSEYLGAVTESLSMGFLDSDKVTKTLDYTIDWWKNAIKGKNLSREEYERKLKKVQVENFTKTYAPYIPHYVEVSSFNPKTQKALAYITSPDKRSKLFVQFDNRIKQWIFRGRLIDPSTLFLLSTTYHKYGEIPKDLEKNIQSAPKYGDLIEAVKKHDKKKISSILKQIYIDEKSFSLKHGKQIILEAKKQYEKHKIQSVQKSKPITSKKYVSNEVEESTTTNVTKIPITSKSQGIISSILAKGIQVVKSSANKAVEFIKPIAEASTSQHTKTNKPVKFPEIKVKAYKSPKGFVKLNLNAPFDVKKLQQELIQHEGVVYHVYKDNLGYPTIGTGHLLPPVGIPLHDIIGYDTDVITPEQNATILNYDIARTTMSLYSKLPWLANQPEKVQRALVDMAFNMGVGGVLKFRKTLDYIRSGEYKKAAQEMLHSKWAKQVKRRATDIANLVASAKPTSKFKTIPSVEGKPGIKFVASNDVEETSESKNVITKVSKFNETQGESTSTETKTPSKISLFGMIPGVSKLKELYHSIKHSVSENVPKLKESIKEKIGKYMPTMPALTLPSFPMLSGLSLPFTMPNMTNPLSFGLGNGFTGLGSIYNPVAQFMSRFSLQNVMSALPGISLPAFSMSPLLTGYNFISPYMQSAYSSVMSVLKSPKQYFTETISPFLAPYMASVRTNVSSIGNNIKGSVQNFAKEAYSPTMQNIVPMNPVVMLLQEIQSLLAQTVHENRNKYRVNKEAQAQVNTSKETSKQSTAPVIFNFTQATNVSNVSNTHARNTTIHNNIPAISQSGSRINF